MKFCDECDGLLTGRQRKYDSDRCSKKGSRRAWVFKVYGITLEQYDAILDAQGGGCGICGRTPRDGKALAIDHDHTTGFVRGLLCFFCNKRILGARTADILVKTAAYVTSPPARAVIGEVVAPGRPPRKRQPRKRKARRK